MITAWIDEKKLGDSLQDFQTDHLGAVQTFMGKSLRPFSWHIKKSRHLFDVNSFICFLGAIEILVLTELEKFYYNEHKNILYIPIPNERPLILFGDAAKHAIQKFQFAHVETIKSDDVADFDWNKINEPLT